MESLSKYACKKRLVLFSILVFLTEDSWEILAHIYVFCLIHPKNTKEPIKARFYFWNMHALCNQERFRLYLISFVHVWKRIGAVCFLKVCFGLSRCALFCVSISFIDESAFLSYVLWGQFHVLLHLVFPFEMFKCNAPNRSIANKFCLDRRVSNFSASLLAYSITFAKSCWYLFMHCINIGIYMHATGL